MGQEKTKAPISSKKAWKTLPACLTKLTSEAIKTLNEETGSEKTIKSIEMFCGHINKWWYLVR